jgi:hypothetical protein
MPRGPKGEKRPAHVICNAVHVMRVLTGEIEDTIPDDGKDPAAKALGEKGGAPRRQPAALPAARTAFSTFALSSSRQKLSSSSTATHTLRPRTVR